jgi:hypothetical protein|tara:strand:- start:1067 stop:1441 length:375 start_codon:yes stop_codon:yes gene_type:complete
MIREYKEIRTGEMVVEYICDGCTFRTEEEYVEKEMSTVGSMRLCNECVEMLGFSLEQDQEEGRIKLYFENFPKEDAEGNGVGSASYAESIGTLTIEPDLEMWEALRQWAKRSGFTDITSGTNLD